MSALLVARALLLLVTCAVAFKLPSLSARARKVEALSLAAVLLASWLLDRYAFASAEVWRSANLLLLGYVFVRSSQGETRLLPVAALAVVALTRVEGWLHTPILPVLAVLCSFAPSRAVHALLVTVFLLQVSIASFP